MKEDLSMRHTARLLVLLLSSFLLPPFSFLRADGGAVRLMQRQGGYRVAVFTSPTPFRVGTVDVSVYVVDADTAEPVPDARVTIRAVPRDRPEETIRCSATSAAATNKLFRAAVFELPESGWWDVETVVEATKGTARVCFAVEAAEPPPRWRAVWPWTAWPAAVVVLFGLHQVFARRGAVRPFPCGVRPSSPDRR
jgi:hypothetical protein